MNLFGSICLSDIPKELIQTSQSNGKKYITLCINEKKAVDEYGNTHYCKIYQKADPALGGAQQPVYLGNFKASEYGQQTAQPAAEAQPAPQYNQPGPAAPLPQDDDLPF